MPVSRVGNYSGGLGWGSTARIERHEQFLRSLGGKLDLWPSNIGPGGIAGLSCDQAFRPGISGAPAMTLRNTLSKLCCRAWSTPW